MSASSLQRWSVFLSGFSYKLEYIKDENNNMADMLSRHPIEVMYISSNYELEPCYLNMAIEKQLPVDYKKVAVETCRDITLSKV